MLTRSISNNNFFLNKVNLDLDVLIKELITKYKSSVLSSNQVNIELENIKADIDREAFDSILSNILSNAVKYSPTNSIISIQLKKVDESIYLTLCDEGEGIDNNLKNKVFNKFFRIENEMTRKSKGTGLGLYITKYLVESHGGEIKLLNNQPKGLKIEIIFK